MRDISTLVYLYPEKTGKEILEIQEQDKIEDQKRFEKAHQADIDWMNEINTNGGYFKRKFDLKQRYYYKVSNVKLDKSLPNNPLLYGTVESVIVFLEERNENSVKTETKTLQILRNYDLENCTRTSKEDWDSVNKYIIDISKFWDDIK
jgi:hypothetical protein